MEKSKKRSVEDWHDRFEQQAQWTYQARHYLINELRLINAARILDVGCGTGVVTQSTQSIIEGSVCGLDISPAFLKKAQQFIDIAPLVCGDAYHIPFRSNIFDACVCHFLMLWLNDTQASLKEMVRVTKPGGYIVLFAEPDYAGRIDYPAKLIKLGKLQEESLKLQGADPNIGRTLAHLLVSVGCGNVNTGLLGGHWSNYQNLNQVRSEWATLRSDLSALLDEEAFHELYEIDLHARQKGERILFVPTFYAWGQISQ